MRQESELAASPLDFVLQRYITLLLLRYAFDCYVIMRSRMSSCLAYAST